MKVRTLKRHGNAYKPQYVKNPGRKYELPARDAERLIASGHVVEDKPESKPEPDES